MDTHITWNITYLRKYSTCESHSDIVYDIGWVCSGLNTTGVRTSFDYKGCTGVSTTGLTDPIPYSSLTEGDVIGWVRGNADNQHVENSVHDFMTNSDHLVHKTLPWD
jgi:hypothetical protein|tara:strand:- start:213 stop:533 length:321 start_codon:yes stop_codon:yes gene_type:complete